MEEFKLENYPSIKLCLIHYYKKSGMEKKTGKPIEDWLYKAKELFSYVGDGHISILFIIPIVCTIFSSNL